MQKHTILKLPSSKTELYMARIDLVDPDISGNKWYKLKHNLKKALEEKHEKILTFGGAYSNHIYATAAAAKRFNLKSIGIVRGEESLPLNPTLKYAVEQGMQIHYISRSDYRKRQDNEFIRSLNALFGDFYYIPEGGTNALALTGVEDLVREIGRSYDYWITPLGTGGTMAGIASGLEGSAKAIGIAVLKGAGGIENDVKNILKEGGKDCGNWEIIHDYHFGGYAKMDNNLLEFILGFKNSSDILLDPVYTGKMMYGIYDLIDNGFFPKNSKILALHTGGLQGWGGMKERDPNVRRLLSANGN